MKSPCGVVLGVPGGKDIKKVTDGGRDGKENIK